MKNKLIYLFISTILILSCTDKSDNIIDSHYLKFSENKIFYIDENTYYFSKSISSFIDENTGKEYFSFENNEKRTLNEILIFDMETTELVKRINIMEDGPDAVHGLFGHYIHDLDNIYITSSAHNMLYHLNGDGKVHNRYNYYISDDGEPLSLYFFLTYTSTPPIIIDSIFYIPQRFFHAEMDGDDWKNAAICGVMNLKTREVKKLPMSYPVLFEKRNKIMSDLDVSYSLDYDGENFIYAFFKSNTIIVTKDHISHKTFPVKSRYADNIICNPNPGDDIMKISKASHEQSMYWHFMYDKYRDLYYRFVFLPCDPEKNPMRHSQVRDEFTVMILNKDFQVIGETKFPKDKYLPKMSFIGKDGLYISENNPYNENFDEDKIVFSCFLPEVK